MGDLDDILQRLPQLARADLEQVKARAGFLLSMGAGNEPLLPGLTQPDDDLVMEAIAHVLSGLGIEYVSVVMLRKSPHYGSFRSVKVPALMKYVRAAVQTRNEQRAFLCLAVQLLYDNLIAMGLPVTARTVMQHIHRVPAVMNRNFPGYAESSMLSWIITRGVKHARQERSGVEVPGSNRRARYRTG